MEFQYVAFLVAILLLTLSPGVDTLLVLRNSARGGWQDGALTTLGISSGLFVHAAVSALGISVILLQSAWAFTLLKLAGALYLIWLGLMTLRSTLRNGVVPTASTDTAVQRLRPWRSLSEGVLSNVLNPKAVIFYMAFLPQFIDPAGSALVQSMAMAFVHFTISMLWLCGLSLVADRARRLRMPRLGRAFNAVNGLLLMTIGTIMARS
ncbi:threonine transporter RhtB [Marinobacterium zhoushanense]|uniref:Threonine transporter RhtB n=1 Tax=Marinobacterium zhoushanense TaxID=1679163 RepID=A0ABQ1JVU9_9GAMM|nr:LysE family translocator [Marinobacterium zhoushanense]GGB79757.1 threonine transporter RhtB [Marinobacterium zhoushanense]